MLQLLSHWLHASDAAATMATSLAPASNASSKPCKEHTHHVVFTCLPVTDAK